jgi:hypothetical protein
MTAIVLSIASTAMGAMAAYQQGKAQKASLEYQAAVNRNNAIAARQNKAAIQERAERAEDEHRIRIARAKGSTKVGYAASGVLVDDPDATVDYVLQDIAQWGEYDIAKMYDDANLRKRQAEIQGMNFDAKAELAMFESSTIKPMQNALGVLVGGAGDAYSMGASMNYTGITGGNKPLFT